MKILLDECVPKRLYRQFPHYFVKTVRQKGWTSVKNGNLLRLAEAEFDVFLTVDQNIPSQQNLEIFDIAVIILFSKWNRLEDLLPLVPQIHQTLETIRPGNLVILK